jgi:hypothetical protein
MSPHCKEFWTKHVIYLLSRAPHSWILKLMYMKNYYSLFLASVTTFSYNGEHPKHSFTQSLPLDVKQRDDNTYICAYRSTTYLHFLTIHICMLSQVTTSMIAIKVMANSFSFSERLSWITYFNKETVYYQLTCTSGLPVADWQWVFE